MPRKKVPLIPGQYYHVFNRAIAGSLLFREEGNYLFFLTKMDQYLPAAAELLGYCLMPNHYHFMLQLTSEELPNAMQRLGISYALAYNKYYNQSGHLFQGTFQRKQANNLNYLLHLSRYIHLNPVKANLVEQPEDWPFSSYQGYIGIKKPYQYNPQPILDLICDQPEAALTAKHKAYQSFVKEWDDEFMELKGIKTF